MRPHVLTLSAHAESRAYQRGISADKIMQAIKNGQRRDCGECVLHYSLYLNVGVVVNWQRMEIVTVYHLSNHRRWLLHNGLPLPSDMSNGKENDGRT